jgi:hypothetical protein
MRRQAGCRIQRWMRKPVSKTSERIFAYIPSGQAKSLLYSIVHCSLPTGNSFESRSAKCITQGFPTLEVLRIGACGAGGSRTHTLSRAEDFKSPASAISATAPNCCYCSRTGRSVKVSFVDRAVILHVIPRPVRFEIGISVWNFPHRNGRHGVSGAML